MTRRAAADPTRWQAREALRLAEAARRASLRSAAAAQSAAYYRRIAAMPPPSDAEAAAMADRIRTALGRA